MHTTCRCRFGHVRARPYAMNAIDSDRCAVCIRERYVNLVLNMLECEISGSELRAWVLSLVVNTRLGSHAFFGCAHRCGRQLTRQNKAMAGEYCSLNITMNMWQNRCLILRHAIWLQMPSQQTIVRKLVHTVTFWCRHEWARIRLFSTNMPCLYVPT